MSLSSKIFGSDMLQASCIFIICGWLTEIVLVAR